MDRDMMEWMKPFQKTFEQDFFKGFQHLINNNNNNQQNSNLQVNLYEGYNEMLCVVLLPGIENVDMVSLKVHLNTIEVSGNIDVQFNNFKLTQKEFQYGDFKRVIQLPYAVRNDKVDATYKQGLLIIQLYKLLNQNDQRISIKNVE
ncbi:Hsp20 family protein [Bacillaceae bacterium IKA-2]|nr:Hsp20 family protein [Bacillaceae bacterium IKA-2]